jgi:regulatory protein
MNVELQKKLERFCAYQERCKYDVLRKISALRQAADNRMAGGRRVDDRMAGGRTSKQNAPFTDKDVTEVLNYLEQEKYIDENRYAHIFAVSKLRQKQWGKHKIKAHLKAKGINEENIQAALTALDSEEYKAIQNKLTETKGEQIAFAHGF